MKLRFLVLVVFSLLATASGASAQDRKATPRTLVINKPETAARLIDEFGILNSEERSARFDRFFSELSNDPNAMGYVLLYCGKKCRYDEIVAHIRGMELKIRFRGFDRSRLVIQDAGFRESFRTELWLVPGGACPPPAKSTIPLADVKFSTSRLNFTEAYDCC